ncbi:MAG: ABC transporter permease, partial [Oscillospiraceae bacterium]
MKITDMIKMTLQNLFRRKSRTILTVLGVVVGCCAIVTMLSIGIGVQNSQRIMLEGMGDLTLIQVYSGGSNSKLDDDALRKFENIPNVDVAVGKTSLDNIGMEIYAGDNNRYHAYWAEVVGINKDAMEKFGFELIEGSYPKDKFQVLAGQYTAYNFEDTQRPEGSNMIDRWSYMYQYNP